MSGRSDDVHHRVQIRPIKREARRRLGHPYPPGYRAGVYAELAIGISADLCSQAAFCPLSEPPDRSDNLPSRQVSGIIRRVLSLGQDRGGKVTNRRPESTDTAAISDLPD